MNDSKAMKAQNLARIRDNQRRSRARRKEYLQELEAKLRNCEQMGIEASAEIQSAARKVLDENRKLRALLRERGVSEAEIATVMGTGDRSLECGSAAAALNTMLDRRIHCGGLSCTTPPPNSTSAPATAAVAPISIPARRSAPLSEYGSQSPHSTISSVDTPPAFSSTPFIPVTMTPAPEMGTDNFIPTTYSFDQSNPSTWGFPLDMSNIQEATAYYNTSCIDAANIIRSMAADVGPELEVELGCRTGGQNCFVDNSVVFNVMDKYSTPINGMM
ncbi:hypothetical protein CC78DRAFT_529818 [Lojkania enalia]|uniref:BZIP domain-containing protein n=1 Tax=Lojkania enalia TaxID=147567 RepID=A0A9P4N3S7_9PLEO|nr:hypothetical protein CC78DRAFT_529818 [Didymosphaeria enalia]